MTLCVNGWKVTARGLQGEPVVMFRHAAAIVPHRWEISACNGDVAAEIVVSIAHQRLVVEQLSLSRLGAGSLTAAIIRAVPVERLALASAEAIGLPASARCVTTQRRPHDELIAEIVGMHKNLVGDPAPAVTIGEALGYSSAYIRKLLVEARKDGLLPRVGR